MGLQYQRGYPYRNCQWAPLHFVIIMALFLYHPGLHHPGIILWLPALALAWKPSSWHHPAQSLLDKHHPGIILGATWENRDADRKHQIFWCEGNFADPSSCPPGSIILLVRPMPVCS